MRKDHKRSRRPGAALLSFIFTLGTLPAPVQAAESPCKSAVLINTGTGQLLYERNPDGQVPPASVIKTLTLLLVERLIRDGNLSPDDHLNVSLYKVDRTRKFSPGATPCDQAAPPDKVVTTTIRNAMTLAGVISSNAHALALAKMIEEKTGKPFGKNATALAKQLGMNDTSIVDGAGVTNAKSCHHPENAQNRSTARDLTILAAQIEKSPLLQEILSEKGANFEGKFYTNTNHLKHLFAKTGTVDGWSNIAGFDPKTNIAFALCGCKDRFRTAASLLAAHSGTGTAALKLAQGTAENKPSL